MNDRNGFGIAVGCYVRATPRAPRKAYRGWVTRVGEKFLVVENDRGHREEFLAEMVTVLKPSKKAAHARACRNEIAHAVSVAAHRNLRK